MHIVQWMLHSESSKLLKCPRIMFFLGIHAILQYITVILPSLSGCLPGVRDSDLTRWSWCDLPASNPLPKGAYRDLMQFSHAPCGSALTKCTLQNVPFCRITRPSDTKEASEVVWCQDRWSACHANLWAQQVKEDFIRFKLTLIETNSGDSSFTRRV